MKALDLHCDTYTRVANHPLCNLRENPYQIDLNRLKQIDATGQVFAIFHDCKGNYTEEATNTVFNYLRSFQTDIIRNSDITQHITGLKIFQDALQTNTLSSFLGVEDGGLIAYRLKDAFDLGVRIITLTWNYINDLGHPTSHPTKGLTPYGFEFIQQMNQLGIVIDVSHLSDQGIRDVYTSSTRPFIASHSNARAIKDHPRNLPDDLIKNIAEKGGVIGLNFYTAFVSENEATYTPKLAKHLHHFIKIGGEDCVAIGSDFDGIPNITDFGNIAGLPIFAYNLKKLGFTESFIDKLFYKNAVRTFQNILK